MAVTLQMYRGNKTDMPLLAEGEPAFTLDERGFYVGDGEQNILFARADHTHPGGLLASVDLSDLGKVIINDGQYNQSEGRIEATYGG